MSARPDDALFDTISGGGAIMNRSPRMPAYGTTLTSAQIRALVRHIRSLCQCTGPAWSSDGERAPE
jgi:mono/diheme cytochrome c family protein